MKNSSSVPPREIVPLEYSNATTLATPETTTLDDLDTKDVTEAMEDVGSSSSAGTSMTSVTSHVDLSTSETLVETQTSSSAAGIAGKNSFCTS